jgi:hypothetical protein
MRHPASILLVAPAVAAVLLQNGVVQVSRLPPITHFPASNGAEESKTNPASLLLAFQIAHPSMTNMLAGPLVIVQPPGGLVPSLPRMGEARLNVTAPEPGISEAAPFACIVVVPGSNHDDQCIVTPGDSGSKMKIIKPDLRLIPRSAK